MCRNKKCNKINHIECVLENNFPDEDDLYYYCSTECRESAHLNNEIIE